MFTRERHRQIAVLFGTIDTYKFSFIDISNSFIVFQ